MGLAKHQLEHEDELYRMAEKILMSLGIIGCCDMHEDFHYQKKIIDESHIYAMTTEELKKNYPLQTDFKEFHRQIHRVLQETPATSAKQCPYCEKLWKE